MTDTAPRPASTRGRGSARGGRGGSRGGARHRERQPNGDYSKETMVFDDFADQGELGEMKKQYSSQLSTLKELFSDWTDVDLLFALQETDGDLNRTIEHISEGHVSQFSDVKKTKERAKPKTKDQLMSSDPSSSSRSARGRGAQDSTRGTRGRPDRGRGGTRSSRGGQPANGVRANAGASATATDTQEWGAESLEKSATDAPQVEGPTASQLGSAAGSKSAAPASSDSKKGTVPPPAAAPKKTWAQMFAKPAPVPTIPKTAAQPPAAAPPAPENVPEILASEQEDVPTAIADDVPSVGTSENQEPLEINVEEPSIELEPSKDKLTEDNVEHLPDASHPPPTGTAASTVDSASRGPDSATPSVVGQTTHQVTITRPVMGGFATTAFKATAVTGGRSASFNRRLFEQQEAVVLPGNHAVDRVGVQFGQMGLNGDVEDVDDEREDAETRPQPPQHSPPSQPRAALPALPGLPSGARPPSVAAPVETAQETVTVTKPAPGLPPAPQQHSLAQQSPSNQITSQIMSQPTTQAEQSYNQFGRYGQTSTATDHSAASQKPYDPFGQQQAQSAFSGYPSHSQAPAQTQQAQSQLGAYSSAASDFSSFYTTDQQRNSYQNYYGSGYGQQTSSGQQDAVASQQRTGSAFGASAADSSLSASQGQQAQSRYGDNQQSGTTTPNPTVGGQQQSGGAQSQHGQHMHQQQQHSQNQHSGAYPYGAQAHAYYNRMDPYYAAYMNQFGYNQGGFSGAGGFGKGGMYGGPHGYGINPQSGYDQHSSSPANVGGFSQSSMRSNDTSATSGLGDYTRSGSAQPSHSQQQASGTSAFGGMGEMFGRSGSGFSGQNQAYGQQQTSSQTTAAEDSLKPFGDTKTAGGPSPSGLGQPGRPGSATNSTGPSQGSGLPPQSQQHAFGGYGGGHMNQMQSGQASQYGGLGGLGGHQGGQGHQTGGYGYGAGFGSNNNYQYGRGGWGGNYGH